MKKCTYCGKTFADEARKCPFDGQPLAGAPAAPSGPPPVPRNIVGPARLRSDRLLAASIVLLGLGLLLFIVGVHELSLNRLPFIGVLASGLALMIGGALLLYQTLTSSSPKRPVPKPPATNKCGYCGRAREGDAEECPGCGTPFGAG